MEERINPFQRFFLAFVALFAVLFHREFALGVKRLREGRPALPPGQAPAQLPVKTTDAAHERGALHLLSILQREGRFIDFLQEDLAGFSDGEVGAAARTVHEGCRNAVSSYFRFEPIYREPEGAGVVLENGFDAASVRLTGNVVGNPPFRGSLKHHGWRASEVKLPAQSDGQDPAIVAPAEVELP